MEQLVASTCIKVQGNVANALSTISLTSCIRSSHELNPVAFLWSLPNTDCQDLSLTHPISLAILCTMTQWRILRESLFPSLIHSVLPSILRPLSRFSFKMSSSIERWFSLSVLSFAVVTVGCIYHNCRPKHLSLHGLPVTSAILSLSHEVDNEALRAI